ncbi:MAG: autotransporter outer membrane beta-barrel domain-containing protein [Pseudomonadota bacterium]
MTQPRTQRSAHLRNLAVSTALICSAFTGYLLGGTGGRSAYAGSCTPAPPSESFTCVGPADSANDTYQTLYNAGPVTVTTTAGFGIDTTVNGGNALTISSENGLTFTDANSSEITGGVSGIVARGTNEAMSITTTGDVVGAGNYGSGIAAFNYFADASVSVTAASAEGGSYGIDVLNFGSGGVTISTSGSIAGERGAGIRVSNQAGGAISITTTDDVSSTDGTGIWAYNQYSDGTTIHSGNVSGGETGIFAFNGSGGPTTVTTTGTVRGDSSYGIFAYGYVPDGSPLTISVVDVYGGYQGIRAGAFVTSTLFITTTGDVEGGTGAGIFAQNEQTGGAEITISGTVTGGNGVAIDAANMNGGLRLELQPGFGLNGVVDAQNISDDNHLVFGGPAGETTFELDTLATDFLGFEPTFLKEDESNFLFSGANDTPFTEANVAGGVAALDHATLVMTEEIPFVIQDGAALGAIGTSVLDGDVNNFGAILLANSGGFDPIDGLDGTDDQLVITGDYVAGSDLYLDAVLNSGTIVETDQLIIEGDISGETTVFVSNDGGRGGLTGSGATDGIPLILVGGEGDGSFVLGDEAIAGIFLYDRLIEGEDGTWLLQSRFLSQASLYDSLPAALQAIGSATVGQLVERSGVRTDGSAVSPGVWARAVGVSVETDGDVDGTTGGSFDQTIGFLQAGVEVDVLNRESGQLLVGGMVHWGQSSLDATTDAGTAAGSADIDFIGVGLNATWYGSGGWYFDNVVQYTAYDIDLSAAGRWSGVSTDGYGIAISHEAGYRIALGETVALVPQAQLTYSHVDFDDFTDPDGVFVSLRDGDSLVGRLGVAFEGSQPIGTAIVTGYLEANLLHEFLGDNTVTASGTTLDQDLGGTSAEVGFGGTVAVFEGVSVFAEIDYTLPFDDGLQGVQASGGVRLTW